MDTFNSNNSNDRIIKVPKSSYQPNPGGLGCEFFKFMKIHQEKIAQIDALTGERDSYKSLLQRCIRTALKMRSLGVVPNDIVSTCTFNHLNNCVPFIAALFLGAKISNFDPTLSLQDTVHLMKQVTPKIIFVGLESLDAIEEAVGQIDQSVLIVAFGESDKYISFSEFLQSDIDEATFEPYEVSNLKETAIILFSSGTTGLPKGISIHHYGFMHQQMNAANIGFCSDITLGFSSLYWITPTSMLGMSIFAGTTRLIIPKFDPVLIWKSIETFKPTFLYAIPFHYLSLCDAKPLNADVSSIKHIGIGGGHLIKDQILKIRNVFSNSWLCNGYGQTEMAMFITVFKPNKCLKLSLNKPTSCGTGMPGISYKIVDIDSGEVLGPNQPGELRLKTDYCLSGYYNMDASDCWDKDGWYRTHDLVYYDEDECFYVVDRLKEFLKFQSWHIPPALLESILVKHPEISNAVIIGLPHEIDETHLMALVVLSDPSSSITTKEIEKFVEAQVDDRKRLRGGVKIVDNIPMSETGKIQRRKIRDMYLRGEI